MKIWQSTWSPAAGWTPGVPEENAHVAELVFAFGSVGVWRAPGMLEEFQRRYPAAQVVGCSTAGEIFDTRVLDDSLVATAVRFDRTALRTAKVELAEMAESYHAGERLARLLPATVPATDGAGGEVAMTHVFVFSDGLHVNGSDLVRGLAHCLPADVPVTGGLAGDGARFSETLVVCNAAPASRLIAAVALYGRGLRVGFASLGGWDPFGPERVITKARGNVLYELDGHSALGLYEKYLGEQAQDLPASGLLFPLSLRLKAGDTPVVRTILAIDRAAQTMTFAGDVPQGAYARLMKANFDRLIDGAAGAARASYQAVGSATPELALLISCVGRKLVLRQRVEEEVEGVRDVLGTGAVLTGFYSYGEISPFTPGAKCELHNQTMTITTLSEK